jgi:hypothetical protein
MHSYIIILISNRNQEGLFASKDSEEEEDPVEIALRIDRAIITVHEESTEKEKEGEFSYSKDLLYNLFK